MGRFKYFLLLSFLAFTVLWLGGFILFARKIRNYPLDTETPTEAIVVLTGGRNRLSEAMRLYNAGKAEMLIISGVSRNVTLKELEVQNHTIINNGINRVVLGKEATNTIENAIEVSDAVRRNGINSVRLVTSNYHMPRSEQEILGQNPDIKIVYHPVYSENVSPKWWKQRGSFLLIASEYNKFMYVFLKNFIIRTLERN